MMKRDTINPIPISKRLKELRTLRGLSMRETARLIGVPETTYREWEYGRAIRGEPYLAIAKAFGVSLQELLGERKELMDAPVDIDRIISDVISLKAYLQKLKNETQ